MATRSLEVGNMCRFQILGKFGIPEEHFCDIENQFCLLGGGMLGPTLGFITLITNIEFQNQKFLK